MTSADRTLAKMRQNPRDWRIDDLKAVADRLGIDWDHSGTSHCVFRHPGASHLSVPAHRPILPIYIRRFLALVDAVTKGAS
ncbi:hypothetical protein C3Y92_01480 [Solidesulfovibrio carbinolicus]|uniref:Type II toxin-antitoxin system HicA family toxin n=2 Tax=Solidesulfovibrio carbinolicus TaxID=296842 RepID=A0A4P6HFU2_9BACT|nr:hypothetical protein C3Y92_01480 [Solidesulfovibrio carbinolicus]